MRGVDVLKSWLIDNMKENLRSRIICENEIPIEALKLNVT
jgi:hypothetical protein